MMPPSNQVESNAEDSSSSGGSVVQSMNLLSTAKGSSSSSGDSPDNSDMSGKHETSEVSEDSDHESAKEATDCTVSKSALDLPTKEKAPEPIAATQENESHVKSVPTRADELVLDVASASVPPGNDSDQSVEALALIAVEAAAKHAPVVQAGVQVSSNATGTQLKPLAESLSVAGSSQSVNLHGSSSSDQSVQYTVDSSISGNSSRSNEAPFSPTSGFQTIGAAAAAAVAAAVEPKIPMGQIHLKQRKSSPVSKLHPAPIASMPTAPMMNTTASTTAKSKSSSSLRRGKWTVEEEAYVARVIQDFNSGFLNAPAGTTLRSYLSEKLHCDPMRITKKFTGDACIGKRVFHPAVRCSSNAAAIDKAQAELDALERRWRRRLEMQQRESAKKAAASAAAAVAAATGRSHLPGHGSSATAGSATMVNPHLHGVPVAHPGTHHVNQTAVARTATWLDRANAILQAKSDSAQPVAPRNVPSVVLTPQDQASSFGSLPQREIENQMKEVQRLIHEGPIIQQTTAGLPHLLEQGSQLTGQRKVTEDQEAVYLSSPAEHADKRARTSSASGNSSGAEDAEALVGFLKSVRASAEASGNAFGAP